MNSTALWPKEIRLKPDRQQLEVVFTSGARVTLGAELLRVESPSAEVQGHAPSQKIHVTGKENVKITAVHPVGNYAVRLVFDDGHATGIYSWQYLQKLAQMAA